MGHSNVPLVEKLDPAQSNGLSLPSSGRFGKLAGAHCEEEAAPQKVCRMVFLVVADLGRREMEEVF